MIWRAVKSILIGLLALVALPLVLLLVLLAIIFLAIPVRYKVNATTGRGEENRTFARVTYLFGLVRVAYEYVNSNGTLKIRIFGIPIRRKKRKPPVAEKEAPKPQELIKEEIPKKSVDDEKPKTPIKERLLGIKDSITKVVKYPNRKDIVKLTLKMLKQQWRIIRPKKLNISGEVGFADPSHTGFLFAAYGVVAEFLNISKHVQLSGNFDTPHTVVLLDIYAKGSINIAHMMLPLLNLIRKKPIRRLIKDIIKN